MNQEFTLSYYIDRAMSYSVFEKLEDGTYAGEIPPCVGVFGFGKTLHECQHELRSVLEDWILLGLRLGDEFPVIDNADINEKPIAEDDDELGDLLRKRMKDLDEGLSIPHEEVKKRLTVPI